MQGHTRRQTFTENMRYWNEEREPCLLAMLIVVVAKATL